MSGAPDTGRAEHRFSDHLSRNHRCDIFERFGPYLYRGLLSEAARAASHRSFRLAYASRGASRSQKRPSFKKIAARTLHMEATGMPPKMSLGVAGRHGRWHVKWRGRWHGWCCHATCHVWLVGLAPPLPPSGAGLRLCCPLAACGGSFLTTHPLRQNVWVVRNRAAQQQDYEAGAGAPANYRNEEVHQSENRNRGAERDRERERVETKKQNEKDKDKGEHIRAKGKKMKKRSEERNTNTEIKGSSISGRNTSSPAQREPRYRKGGREIERDRRR